MDHNSTSTPGRRLAESMKFSAPPSKLAPARHDVNSLVTDPHFVDPAISTSPPTRSPALKLGFVPIDLKQVGVRKK